MKRLVLLLALLQITVPAAAEANVGFGRNLATLKDLDEYISDGDLTEGELSQEDIEDEFDEEQAEEDEEEGLAQPAIMTGEPYCETPGVPYLWEASTKKKKKGGKSTRKKGGARCGGCSSGCGMNQNGLKPIIKKFVNAAQAAGIRPVSCIRTQACQDRLRACYERCGQRGRAAKKSKHADGKACDFSKRDAKRLTQIKKKTGLPIKRLTHGREGGGLHEYQ